MVFFFLNKKMKAHFALCRVSWPYTKRESPRDAFRLEKRGGHSRQGTEENSQSGCVYSPKESGSFDAAHLTLMIKKKQWEVYTQGGRRTWNSFADGSWCELFLLLVMYPPSICLNGRWWPPSKILVSPFFTDLSQSILSSSRLYVLNCLLRL